MPARNVSGVTLREFFTSVLKQMGSPVTENNLAKLGAVAALEGHGGDYNPFNYIVGPGTNFNSVGVKNYPDIQTGVNQLIKLLSQKNTSAMRANLDSDGDYNGWLSATSRFYQSWGGPAISINQSRAMSKLNEQIDGPATGAPSGAGTAAAPSSGAAPSGGQAAVAGLSAAPAAGSGPVDLPSDTRLYRHEYGISAIYDVGGAWVEYGIDWFDPNSVKWQNFPVHNVSVSWMDQNFPGRVQGGNARELGSVAQDFGTYSAFWDRILMETMGATNPARNDPEVRKVLAEFAGRPDMSEAELQNRLRATKYWQQRSEAQLEWSGLSEGEKQVRTADMSSRMESAWFQFVGVELEQDNPAWNYYINKLASGEIAFGHWIENVAKETAKLNPETPWSRQLREETEAQRQRPIDIENTSNEVRQLTERWGLRWTDETMREWGKNMVEKHWSDEDLLNEVRRQAQVLYPWKDPSVDTASAAAPWIETYNRVLEQSGTLFTPQIQEALAAGQPIWEFEQKLRKSDAWMGTKNGQDSVYSAVQDVGRMLGFTA